MTYELFINGILKTRGRIINDGYKEKHHIIPKCLGGNNDKENLIELTAEEHFIAHKLLANEYPNSNKLLYAFWLMSHCKKYDTQKLINEKEYAELKKKFSKMQSIRYKGKHSYNYGKHCSEEQKEKLRIANTGKHHTEETKRKCGLTMKGKHHSLETRKRLSEANKGKRLSEETKKKISEVQIGKHLKKETIEKILASRKGYKHSEETKMKISKANKGKKKAMSEARIKANKLYKGKHWRLENGKRVWY